MVEKPPSAPPLNCAALPFVSTESEGGADGPCRPEGDNAVTEKMQADVSVLGGIRYESKNLIFRFPSTLKMYFQTWQR